MSAQPYNEAEIALIRRQPVIELEERWLATIDALRAPLPCGHPAACVRGETTKYCGWCADAQAHQPHPEAGERKS